MGRRFPDGGLLRYRKWVPQQLGDVNKQGSGDSRPMGARHGDTAANHTDLQSGCGRTCVFAVRVWSNLWELIWLRTSHYSMQWPVLTIGRNNTDPESINRDTTNTHWPLNITNIHSLAILWEKYTFILWHNITFQLEQMPNLWEGSHRMKISM